MLELLGRGCALERRLEIADLLRGAARDRGRDGRRSGTAASPLRYCISLPNQRLLEGHYPSSPPASNRAVHAAAQ